MTEKEAAKKEMPPQNDYDKLRAEVEADAAALKADTARTRREFFRQLEQIRMRQAALDEKLRRLHAS